MAEFAARLLDPAEREAVLGDLLEAGETGGSSLQNVLGLVLRRQAQLLKAVRPWLAGFGVALPACYLLMGVSASISCTFERLFRPQIVTSHWWPTGHEGVLLLLCHVILLIMWSWTAGYLCASLSRRTLVFTALLSLAAFRFGDFYIAPLPKICLLLFLLPLLLGIVHGLQGARISPLVALFLAVGMTATMAFCWGNEALWVFNWALSVPAWCLVFTALRSAAHPRVDSSRLIA